MHLTFKTNHLIYLSRIFTISKKRKENILNLKNFRRFLGFTLHCESAESVENWQDLVLISGNRLDYFLSELKLIPNLQNQQKIESWQLFDWKITIEVMGNKNWQRLPCSYCNAPQILKTNNLSYLSSTEKLWNFKNFSQIDGQLRKLRIISK